MATEPRPLERGIKHFILHCVLNTSILVAVWGTSKVLLGWYGNAHWTWERRSVSLDVVSCGFPLAMLLLQKRHRLDGSLLVREACVELHDHIVAIRGTWH